ncbi:hypothetical protein C4J81_17185 [Deltaproteobacteria bacterium Smac51]|nr:hypothetical protein C4J81_17185 [Deltaproteobacteria bacterium Smac51]
MAKSPTSKHDDNRTAAERDGKGRFVKGRSGNPGGRPAIPDAVKAFFAENTMKAAEKLVELINDNDPSIAMRACVAVLDRALGKPDQSHKLESGDTTPTIVVVRGKLENE